MRQAHAGVVRRVLQVMPRSAGGIGHHVADVVRSLDGRDGVVIDVAAPGGVTVPMPKAVLTIEIPRGVRGRAASVSRLRRMYRETRTDVVHAHGLRAGVDAGIAARLEHIPCAVTVHNLVRDEIAGRARALVIRRTEGIAVRLADIVFAPSRQIASHLMSAVPSAASRIEVAYLPPPRPRVDRPPQDVRAELGAASSDRLVITVTRLVRQKALHVLLQALASLPPKFILAIVGEGYLDQELREQAVRLGVSPRVRWLGWRDDVGDLIRAADVFALSSVWEAVGLAAQEAVQLGTPVVSTDVGGMSELIRDGWSGRLVGVGDASALARALEETAGTTEGKRLAERAAQDYRRIFSRERTMDQLARAYLELSTGGADGRRSDSV